VRVSVTSEEICSITGMKPGSHPNIAIPFSELGELPDNESDPDSEFEEMADRLELDAHAPRERFIRLALDRGYRQKEVASLLDISRFALRREINRLSRPARECRECGRPLPREATARREFCDDKSTCRVRAWRVHRASGSGT
jgi:hypothetical protein